MTSNKALTKIYYTLDGSDPNLSTGNYIEYNSPITIELNDKEYKSLTIKAITVYNEVASEIVTYNYAVTSNAQISVNKQMLNVYNFDGFAYLILAEYIEDVLQDIEYYPVTNNSYIDLNNSSLNFDNTVVAYVVRDLSHFKALGYPVCLTDPQNENVNLDWNVYCDINIDSIEANVAENNDFINVTFTTGSNEAQFLMIALFEKNSKYDVNNALYFGMVEKNDDNTYTFTIKKSLLQVVLNEKLVNNSTLVLLVSPNGTAPIDTKEVVYIDSSETYWPASMIGNGSVIVIIIFVVASVGAIAWVCIKQKKRCNQ